MVFSLSACWWLRIRGLWKLPYGRDWLREKLGLVLMGGAMLSKSLIQFSIDGESCLPSLLFTWGQTMVEVMKIMVTSFKRSRACTAILRDPNPAAGHHRPMPLLETPGYSQASLSQSLVRSLLLSPGSWCTRFCLCPPRVYFQSCVSSGSSMVGLMVTPSKRAYAIPKSAAPRAPVPVAVHCWPVPPQEMLKHSSVSVSVGSLCPSAHKVPVHPKGNQSWIFIGRTDVEAETLILWPPDAKSWLIWKDPDAGKDWRREEKGMTEYEMVGWHQRLNGHEFEWTLGVGDEQRGLVCCSPWGCKELNMTEWLNWTELNIPLCISTTTSLSIHLSMDI